MSKKIIIVDYQLGNLFSVNQVLVNIGLQPKISSESIDIESADAIVLPGVGAFKDAMDNLNALNLSNPIIEAVRNGKPLFGICLGFQLLALACGAKTEKMKFGHHGANHPVQDLATGRVMITSQNHGFAVDEPSLPANLRATHKSLFDGSLQGIHRTDKPAFSFQGHPEASPGPHDADKLFDHFIELMKAYALHRN